MTFSESQPRAARPGGGRTFRRMRPKACQFCVDKVRVIDYKDIGRLRNAVTDRGKIKPRGQTGTCATHQRKVAAAVKRARHMALLPYVAE